MLMSFARELQLKPPPPPFLASRAKSSRSTLTCCCRIYDLLVSVESHITDEDLERDLLKALKEPSKSCYLNVVCQLIVCEDRLNAHYNKEGTIDA